MKVEAKDIIAIIRKLPNPAVKTRELVVDLPLAEQGIDSLDTMSIVLDLEDSFGIRIPDEALDKGLTIDRLLKYLNGH